MSENPLKVYLKYAKEFDKLYPVIALCCRSHYVGKQIEAKQRSKGSFAPEESKEINELLNVIEKAHRELGLTREERKKKVEEFCTKALNDIVNEELTIPKLTVLHAVQFNAVANFIEILKIFGSLDDAWEEHRRYCKYKGASILKCIKSKKNPPRGKPSNSEKVFKELFDVIESEEEKQSIVKRLILTEEEKKKIAEEEERIKREELEAKRQFVERIKKETEEKFSVIPDTKPTKPEPQFAITKPSEYVGNYPSIHESFPAASVVPLSADIEDIIIPTTGTKFNVENPMPDDVIIPAPKGSFISTRISKARKGNELKSKLQAPAANEIPDEDVIIPYSHIKRSINPNEESKGKLDKPVDMSKSTKLDKVQTEDVKFKTAELPKTGGMSPKGIKEKDAEFGNTVLRIMNSVEYALEELRFINVKNGKEYAKTALQDFAKLNY